MHPFKLAPVFILSFIAPVVVGIVIANTYFTSETDTQVSKKLFDSTYKVSEQGNYLKIEDSERLSPISGEDLIIAGWFRISKLPERGQRTVLFSKIDAKNENKPGYALAIENDAGEYRATTYWRNSLGEGGWYPFSSIQNFNGRWFFLGLTFRSGNLLGAHYAEGKEEKRELKLLGGHELSKEVLPQNDASLLLGAFGQNLYRGEIGPITLIIRKDIASDLKEIFDAVLNDPLSDINDTDENDIKLRILKANQDSSVFSRKTSVISSLSGEKGVKKKQR